MRIQIIGAGCVGRGLLGRLLCSPQHEVIFLDKNKEVVDRLNTLRYYHTLGYDGSTRTVGPCSARLLSKATVDANLVFISVQMENLHNVIEQVGADVRRPTNVFLVENGPNLVGLAGGICDNGLIAWRRGIAECVIPEIENQQDPTLVYHDELAHLIVGDKAKLADLLFKTKLAFSRTLLKEVPEKSLGKYWHSKWLQHCALHLVVGLLGLKNGLTLVQDVVRSELYSQVSSVVFDTAESLEEIWPDSEVSFMERGLFELQQMRKNPIDTCARVARNPRRKCIRGERLQDLYDLLSIYGKPSLSVVQDVFEFAKTL